MSRPRRKWDDIIEIDLQEVICGRMDCIEVGQDREMVSLGGKSPLSRPKPNCGDITEIDSHEVGCGRIDCIELCQVREVGNLEEREH